LNGSVLAPDDAHAFSAAPFGQPLFCYLIKLFGGDGINTGPRGPSSIRPTCRPWFRHKKTRKEAV